MSGVLNNQVYQLFLVRKCSCKCRDTHIVSTTGGITAGNVTNIFLINQNQKSKSESLRMYFPPLIPPLLIRMILYMTPDLQTEIGTHTAGQQCSSSSSVKCQVIFSYAFKQSCWWDRWLWNSGAEGPAAEDHILVPQFPQTLPQTVLLFNMCQVLVHLALKGNERRHFDWFDLFSAQNIAMTNSESKHHLFAPSAAV